MQNLLKALEEDCEEISKTANTIMRQLAKPEGIPAPSFYGQIMREVSGLGLKWGKHLQLLSQVSIAPGLQDPALAPSRARIETSASNMADQLRIRSSAGWARTPELGVGTIRLRVADTLTSLQQIVEEERRFVRALRQRETSSCRTTASAAKELAVA